MIGSSSPSTPLTSQRATIRTSKQFKFQIHLLTALLLSAKIGHPSVFLKVLHFVIFTASPQVKNHLVSHGVDPDTVHLPDRKFLPVVLQMLVTFFGYRPKITSEQFFKYGYAEQKMLLCTDTISLIKRKHKNLEVQKSLTGKRSLITRSVPPKPSQSTQWQGQQNVFSVECDSTSNVVLSAHKNSALTTPVKNQRICEQVSGSSVRSLSTHSRSRSFEASQRLFGSVAFQMANRHSKKQVDISLKPVDAEATRPNSALRFRESSSSELKASEIKSLRQRKPKVDSTHFATGTFKGQEDQVKKQAAHV